MFSSSLLNHQCKTVQPSSQKWLHIFLHSSANYIYLLQSFLTLWVELGSDVWFLEQWLFLNNTWHFWGQMGSEIHSEKERISLK